MKNLVLKHDLVHGVKSGSVFYDEKLQSHKVPKSQSAKVAKWQSGKVKKCIFRS